MDPTQLAETIKQLVAVQKNIPEEVRKAWTQGGSATSGITSYDLEGPAKSLVPVITPLRNRMPRVMGHGSIQSNWRAVTAINTLALSPGVSQGNRGGVITTSTKDFNATYKGLGFEDSVTYEAEWAAEYFDSVRAISALNLLRSTMIGEEKTILGGNTSLQLGTTPTPVLADVTTGGTLTFNTTFSVICVALCLDGWLNSSVSASGIPAQVTRQNANNSSDTYGGGSAQKSVSATVTTSNNAVSTHSITATVTAVAGAVAYGWYIGAAGSERLAAITTINSAILTSTTTNATFQLASALPAQDSSTNNLVFDGLLTMALNSANGAVIKTMATGVAGVGTPLTADNAGNIVEIDAVLQSLWDTQRLSPTRMYVNSQEQRNIQAKILGASSSAPGAQRFTFAADQRGLTGGVIVRSYLNKFTMSGVQELPIELHPNVPPGTILFVTEELPYPLSNVSNVMQLRLRRDYYQIDWPQTSRKWEMGVYMDGVMQHLFIPSLACITNIANG